eukprot:UN28445
MYYRKLFNYYNSHIQKSPIIKSTRNKINKIKTVKDDIYEKWDTTQDPIIWQIRSQVDEITNETESGIAIRMIQKDIPEFWPENFMEEAQHGIVQPFVEKYLQGDLPWLRNACTNEAEAACFAN